jgi:hypothetical protein
MYKLLAFALLSVAAATCGITCDHSTGIIVVTHGAATTASSHMCWVNDQDTCSCECPDLASDPLPTYFLMTVLGEDCSAGSVQVTDETECLGAAKDFLVSTGEANGHASTYGGNGHATIVSGCLEGQGNGNIHFNTNSADGNLGIRVCKAAPVDDGDDGSVIDNDDTDGDYGGGGFA